MKRVKIFVLLILIIQVNSEAQDTLVDLSHAIGVVARATDRSIKLRWAPTTNYTWLRCNESGYHVRRYTVKKDGVVTPFAVRSAAVPLTNEPIKPWSTAAQWRPLMERDDYAAIGAQAVYGDQFIASTEATPEEQPSLIEQAWEQQNRFGFGLFAADHSWETALALGLAFEDQNVVPGEYYLYRIAPAIQPQESIDTGLVAIGTDDQYALPKPLEVTATFGDQAATIKWNHRLFDQFYVSYWVERSIDGINFEKIHEKPLINTSSEGRERRSEFMLFLDSLPHNGTPFFYRVRGNTPFSEQGPYSDIVQGMGIDPMDQNFPEIDAVLPTEDGGFRISWQFNELSNNKIKGFKIMRGANDQGPFKTLTGDELLSSTERVYTDAAPLAANYYMVVAVDPFNRTMPSYSALAQPEDTIAPSAPKNVRGKVMEDGTMVLTWDRNTEDDMLGYRVYAANDPKAEFSQITKAPESNNYFIDTISLRTLSEQLYVQVMALDYRHNPSDFSDIAVVLKPDTIAPSAPLITAVEVDSLGIHISWASSPAHDLERQVLLRRSRGESNWDTLQSYIWPQDESQEYYIDTSADVRVMYEFQLMAIDDAAMSSTSNIIEAKRIDNYIRKKIENIGAKADRREKQIELLWEYHTMSDVQHFIVYKCTAENTPTSYESMTPQEALYSNDDKKKKYVYSFVDNGVSMNTDYIYQIKAIHIDGGESPLSAKIEINY